MGCRRETMMRFMPLLLILGRLEEEVLKREASPKPRRKKERGKKVVDINIKG
jgi:hypothetical protein